ncbi:hypothetical protein FRB99_008654 [Tulasnella sp. 403]|nr:hypothetical protein FRB99_008654 [Tulasnella sp. 403]
MPKLNLKETKAERDEKEWRKLRKAARKAARYRDNDEAGSGSSSSRRNRAKYPRSNTDGGDEFVHPQEDGWVPPSTASKADEDEIRAQLEEEEFRAKLFDAMGLDSGQDSAQAMFNDFVPPRWQGTSLGDVPGSGTYGLEFMDDEEYAEYVRQGMWERTHKAEHEERQRRAAEAKQRRERDKAIHAETKRLEREEQARRRRREEERKEKKFVDGWREFGERWTILQKASATSTLSPGSLHFQDLPWPIFPPPASPDDITTHGIATFLLSTKHSSDRPKKQRLRDASLLYHPDRFETKFLSAVREKDRERVKDAAGRVIRGLNALAEEER